MKERITYIFILITVLGLGACGGELDTTGTLTVELVGDGEARIVAPGIDCPGTCETGVELSQAAVSTVLGGKKEVDVVLSTDTGDEFLLWLTRSSFTVDWTSEDNCNTNKNCTVVFESICGVATLPPLCAANSVNNIELRALTVKSGSIIDWDRGIGDVCVLYSNDTAQCWESTRESYRDFERTNPPALLNPTSISVYADYACVLDEVGVHCWSDDEVVREPDIEFGLQDVESIALIQSVGCALHANGVSCWLGSTTSSYAGLLDAPSLAAPSNMRREGTNICVDDVPEKVCWLWRSVAQDPVVTRTPL